MALIFIPGVIAVARVIDVVSKTVSEIVGEAILPVPEVEDIRETVFVFRNVIVIIFASFLSGDLEAPLIIGKFSILVFGAPVSKGLIDKVEEVEVVFRKATLLELLAVFALIKFSIVEIDF